MNDAHFFSSSKKVSTILSDLFQKGESKAYLKGEDFDPFQKKKNTLVHLISYGYVKVLGYDKEGRESVHLIYGKGDVFPLINLTYPTNPKGITFKALTNVRLFSISSELLINNIQNNLKISNAIIERLLVQFSQTFDRLENNSCKTAEERVIYCLLFLGARFGLKKDNTIHLENIFTHEIIGKMLGLTRETVSREYEKLRNRGFVDTPAHEIILKDINALTDLVDAPLSLRLILQAETT